jgi:hypothetical protein
VQQLEHALAGLEQVTVASSSPSSWRRAVRERLTDVQDALSAEPATATESWLGPRASTMLREHHRLLTRLSVLTEMVAGSIDPDAVRHSLQRLVLDLHHHQQRINDLAYDAVEMEVGGSE